jgi:transmembrane sensor
MKKTNLDRLFQRYLTGQVTEQERLKIEAWLDVKKTDEGTNLVLDEEDEEKLFQKITSKLNDVKEVIEFRPEENKGRILSSRTWLRLAAAIVILLAGSYSIWLIVNHKPALQETIAQTPIRKVILDDGSIVWLRQGSKLTYGQMTDGEPRQASLEGEALFEVAKDPSRPFKISYKDMVVRVVGTSFNLKTGRAGIELKVLTGKVNVSSEKDKTGVDVTPNETISYTSQGVVERSPLEETEVSLITERTEYNMSFRNTSMQNVIAKIEEKFNIQVKVANAQLNKCRITADFTDQSLEKTLVMISEFLDIDYSIDGNTVAITGNGCKY